MWGSVGSQATTILAEWSNGDGEYKGHVVLALGAPVPVNQSGTITIRLDASDAVPTGELRLHVNQRDVGVFTGTGRSNVVSLPLLGGRLCAPRGPQRGALMRGRAIKHVIHWFSPLPPARTDIAEYTRRILPALNREAQVILWTDQGVWDPGLEAYAAVRTYDPDTFSPANITDARRALDIPPDVSDGVFINIGNNWLFHAGLLSVAQRVTSVVILHDLVLQEMLLDSVRHGKLDGTGYLDAIEENYGSNRTQDRARRSGRQTWDQKGDVGVSRSGAGDESFTERHFAQ